MCFKKTIKMFYFVVMTFLFNCSTVFAQARSVGEATDDFSEKMLTLFKGPLVKIAAGVVLFVGVAGLLRGRHQVAVSCGVAFVLLLMLPVILQYFGDAH